MDYARKLAATTPAITGEDVRAVQEALTALKLDPPCGAADGVFGAATARTVAAFQRSRGLTADGIVGPATWAALFPAPAAPAATSVPAAPAVASVTTATGFIRPADAPPAKPPLSQNQTVSASAWLMTNFGDAIRAAVAGTPFDETMICAIACKETASEWLGWTKTLAPNDVLARCVFDASGDAPNSTRSAFPSNTAAFRAKYGDTLTADLIAEANATRRLRKFGDQQWVYKGYGIFQYDLQHIVNDESFFTEKKWGSFDECLSRCMSELNSKLKASGGDVYDAVRRYNGGGPAARQYASDVYAMWSWAGVA